MERMHRLLNEETDRTEEVQELGKNVIATLARVIETLGKADSVESYEKRVKDLGDLSDDARDLSNAQEQLNETTRAAVKRSEAEKAAKKSIEDKQQKKGEPKGRDVRNPKAEYLSAFSVGDQLLWGAAEPLRRMLRILLEG